MLFYTLKSEHRGSGDGKGYSPSQNTMRVDVRCVSLAPNETGTSTKLSCGLCAKKMPAGGANQNALELPYF